MPIVRFFRNFAQLDKKNCGLGKVALSSKKIAYVETAKIDYAKMSRALKKSFFYIISKIFYFFKLSTPGLDITGLSKTKPYAARLSKNFPYVVLWGRSAQVPESPGRRTL